MELKKYKYEEDREMDYEYMKYDSDEYFKDEDNCANHQRVCEALLNMPDLLVVELIMNWAREKEHTVTVEFMPPQTTGVIKQ